MTTSDLFGTLGPAVNYDPKEHGALCERCTCRNETPVPPTINAGSVLTAVAEAPGRTEVEQRIGLVGPSGKEFNLGLVQAGIKREDVDVQNAILCRPREGSLKAHLARVKRLNENRELRGEEPLLAPTVACRPRLLREITDANALLLMGAYAKRAVAAAGGSSEKALKEGRGFPSTVELEYEGRTYSIPSLSTVHPAFVLRYRRWTNIFRNDIEKAVRMARGSLTWV